MPRTTSANQLHPIRNRSRRAAPARPTTALSGSLVAALIAVSMPAAAAADSVTFRFQRFFPNVVHVQLYSNTRYGWTWPAANQVYVLDDYNIHTFEISCQPAEVVCYGGWMSTNFDVNWGLGYNGRGSCSDCCWVCDGTVTEIIELRPTR